jgi:hypothetical protein
MAKAERRKKMRIETVGKLRKYLKYPSMLPFDEYSHSSTITLF